MNPLLFNADKLPWCERLPRRWRTTRLKHAASIRFSGVDKHTVDGEVSVRLCNYVDVYRNERVTPSMEFMSASATLEEIRRFAVKSGDVLITKDSESRNDIAVPAVANGEFDGVVCGYHLAIIRPDSRKIDSRFLARAFQAVGIREQFHIEAKGITRFGLSGDSIASAQFPLPPLGEQHAIADFLDRETARIDLLIGKKKQFTELLETKRDASVDGVVSAGLDPGVEFVPTKSAVFPKIPKHWTLRKLRRLMVRVTRPVEIQPAALYAEIGIRSWGRGVFHKEPIKGALFEEKQLFSVAPGDLVINIVFAWEGAVAVVSEREQGMVASHRFPTFRHTDLVDLNYLLLLLRSEYGRALMGINSPGAAGRNRTIRLSQFLDEEVPVPPLEEQKEIVAAFDANQRHTETIQEKVGNAMKLLLEWRVSLITAAVTGQIDVCHDVNRSP